MKIAITNPTNWPLVRRGAERFINELARDLGSRGHDVTIVAAHPAAGTLTRRDNYSTRMYRRLWLPVMGRFGLLEFHVFFFTTVWHLLTRRYDVALCCTFMDAFAAIVTRPFTGTRCVFWVNSLPPPIQYFRSLSLKGAVFRKALTSSDLVLALSDYMRRSLAERYGASSVPQAVPVNLEEFAMRTGRDPSPPVILCTAALDDRRKGGKLLLRAFDRVKTVHPNAILRLSCPMGPALRAELLAHVSPEFHRDVQFLGAGQLGDLPALFASASVSVLASRWEAFGMVLLESLASGTPVAASRDGAIPEIVTSDEIGRLFDPGPESEPEPVNLEGLVRAILECIELNRDPRTALRCRARAEEFSWVSYGPVIEGRLLEVAGLKKAAAAPVPAG